jgi:hypothetical protein
MRQAVFLSSQLSPGHQQGTCPGITCRGWRAPLWPPLAMVTVMGPGLMTITIAEFRKTQ